MFYATQILTIQILPLKFNRSNFTATNFCFTKLFSYRGQFLNVVITSTQRSQSNFLREFGKGRISKQGDMSDQLMAHIWLWGVQGLGWVPDVLGGVEDPESESSQKVSGGKKSSYWTKTETSSSCKISVS